VTDVNTSRDFGRVISVVAMLMVMLVRATDAPAQRPDCVARGTYVLTLAGGFGGLELRPDGSAELTLIPAHEICAQCSGFPRMLRGTYRSPRPDDGECFFQLRLIDPEPAPHTVDIEGAVAFQGSVLLFQIATDAGLGAGLALRTDTLMQPNPPTDSSTPRNK
jgi:hypothetical protein